MANIDKVSIALSEWAFKVASSFLPAYRIPQGSTIGNMMQGLFGMNPASYNVWNELGFLAEPTIEVIVTPMITQYLGGMSDEQIKSVALKYADAMIEQVDKKGSINLFGMHLQKDAFEDLKRILIAKMGE